MPLSFTGNQHQGLTETSLEALDQNGKRVIVFTSVEALQDFGLGSVQAGASRKYDNGEIESDGRVKVFTSDL